MNGQKSEEKIKTFVYNIGLEGIPFHLSKYGNVRHQTPPPPLKSAQCFPQTAAETSSKTIANRQKTNDW